MSQEIEFSSYFDFEIIKDDRVSFSPDYQEILYLCALASNAVYQTNPFDALDEGLFSHCGHSISRLCVSKSKEEIAESNLIVGLKDLKYMIFESDQFDKTLFIAFRGTQNLSDFLTDINCIYQENEMLSGKFHSGIYSRSELINLKYFVKKINEGYKIVFTGHSLGAAVASMTAIKLTSRINEDKANNVFFIGFGSPLFADETFSNNFKFSENFHFYINENDIVNSILNDFADIIHNEELSKNYPETDNRINQLLDVILGEKRDAELILEFLKKTLPEIIGRILKTFVPQYHPFGKFFKIQKDNFFALKDFTNKYNILNQSLWHIKYQILSNSKLNGITENIIDPKLMSRVDNHRMNEYYNRLNSILKRRKYDKINISEIQDLKLKAENIDKHIILVKKENLDELFLFLSGENQDQILYVKIRNVKKYDLESISTNVSQVPHKYPGKKETKDSLVYKYNIYKCLLTSDNKLKDKEVEINCEIFGHFNCVSLKVLIKEGDVMEGLTHKQQCIQDMPMDKLYLTAALFVDIINKLEIKDDKISLIKDKKELLDIFQELDKVWANGEKNFNLDNEMKNELEGALLSCLKTDFLDNGLNSILESVSTRFSNKYLPLRTTIDSYSSSELIGKIFPRVYKIKKDLCSTFIKENMFKCIFRSMKNYDLKTLSYLWGYYFKSKDIDDSYKFFLNQIMKTNNLENTFNDLPYLGYIERFISKKIKIENNSNPKDQKLLATIAHNLRIRDILCQNYFFGVMGTKKTGKSTFSQLLTNQDASSSSIDATKTAKPYVLYDNPDLILIDYAHFDDNRAENKLEFYFSVSFLNRVCLIFDAQHKAETDSTSNLFNLIRHTSTDKYSIVFNKCDNLLKDSSGDFTGFKNEICSNLKIENIDDKEKVILASINPNLTLLYQYRISQTMIKDREKLSFYFEKLIQSDLQKLGLEISENKV